MFEAVLQIIKKIIVFSLVSFVFLELCPKEEYKKYISLFTGFVLIIIVLNPIVKVTNGENDINQMIDEYFISNELKDMDNYFEEYEEMRVESIMAEYKQGIMDNVKAIVEGEQLLMDSIDLEINTDVNSESFLMLTHVSLKVSQKYTDSSVKIKEIVLEENQNTESIRIINIKNKISQFYNISLDNININK